MFKNDVDAALFELSEKELLVAILKSQAENYRRLRAIEHICVSIQKASLPKEEIDKVTGAILKFRPADGLEAVLNYIEGSTQPGNTAMFNSEEELTDHLLSLVEQLRVQHNYQTEK